MSLIQVQNLKKSFHGHLVLNDINLEITQGQLICIIGRSGCGKSTLLRCLNGLEMMDEGRIQIGDFFIKPDEAKQFQRQAQNIRHEVGFVFQQFQLFPHLSLIENLLIAPRIVQKISGKEALKSAEKLLERVGLSDHKNKWPSQLSGGQQQRAAIARALLLKPKVMLYDEPTSALDPELVDEVLQVMKTLDREDNITQIVVTHEMRFAREAADHIIFMDEGRIIEQGPPEQIFTNPQDDRTRQFLRKFL